MSLRDCGYMNNILKVDLSTGNFKTEKLDEKIMPLVLGGKGLASLMLYNELAPHTDPLSPEVPLILAVGPLTGTTAPTAGRLGVFTKSPATGTILDSYAGGFFGQTMKWAGYDAIVMTGKADRPKILVIDNDQVRLDDAGEIWGLGTMAATEKLRAKYGMDFKTAVIGPAGERLAPIAGIFCDLRTAGRGGAGAVMGSKNLKGVAVRGSGAVAVHDPEMFQEMVWVANRMLRMSSQIKRMKDHGTANIVELINAAGGLPTRNFQSGQFEGHKELWGETWTEDYWKESAACFGCGIGCTKIARHKKLGVRIDGPEYETIFAVGSNCGVTDREAIIEVNYLCDDFGIDTISVGVIISFVMELFQRGMVNAADLDGIEAKFGSGEALVALTKKICQGEGIGQHLEKGVRDFSKNYPGSEAFAMHVKGLEMPGYLPRGAKGVGLSYAISERGACHLHGSPLSELMGGADPLAVAGKAALFKMNQLDIAVIDSAILCYFTKFGFTLKEVWQMINACTGFNYRNPRALEKVGERATTLARLFNVREGFSKKDDTLPARCLTEPLPSGPAKGHVVELDEMRSEYYQLMGWDENGVPTAEKLRELQLDEICRGAILG
ncbi:MAG: aldehyde ferredoxin oxidoreductase family protein [candidate division KSB1 bacterium]|nr:aldehyde ferredoxin oxidoreductase family protein [candidate division KSB1 bacterium]MDZ7340841.1 aldehyde ferredoxin oxidoreductase family protein [candidate division KSB1 bacterium]